MRTAAAAMMISFVTFVAFGAGDGLRTAYLHGAKDLPEFFMGAYYGAGSAMQDGIGRFVTYLDDILRHGTSEAIPIYPLILFFGFVATFGILKISEDNLNGRRLEWSMSICLPIISITCGWIFSHGQVLLRS